VALLAYALSGTTLRPGDTLTAFTYWQILDENARPLKLFVHLLDQNGAYSGGQDRLDVWYENWRPGDQFAQVQEIVLAPGTKPGDYQVEIGWYSPGTMARLPVIQDETRADRVLLQAISVDY
ncbi:MAG: hypothetical protein JXA89_05180, partial [Anaerolineae bacterium]|nr:hypothetical protein [Anaerolineae bacterium]